MAAWRRRALAVFPELRRDLDAPAATLVTFAWRLVGLARDAHDSNNDATLRRVYGYALWCYRQRALENSIGVAFYEHVLDRRRDWAAVLAWLPPDLIERMWPLWTWRLGAEEMLGVARALEDARRTPGPLPWQTAPEGGE